MNLDQDTALELLKLFKERTGQRHSWREVKSTIASQGHRHAFLLHSQILANWANPKRQSRLSTRLFEVVECFVCSSDFQKVVPEAKAYLPEHQQAVQAGATVTELSGIYDLEETELILFKALEGMWCDRSNLVYLHLHRVNGHNFAIVHLCQKIHVGYKSVLGFPRRDYVDFLASGFLYFENETHSSNKDQFQGSPLRVGQIEKFDVDSDIHRIGVSGKAMRLKLWSKRNRYEVNHEAFCECQLRDSGYEPCIDGSISVSTFFTFLFNSTDSDHVYRFDRANYIKADRYIWSEGLVKEVGFLKEKFDQNKWSVLPNVSA